MKISVIVPLYNSVKTLADCIESLLSQKDGDYEVILVDNASTDNTYEMAQSYLNKVPNSVGYRVIKEPKQGREYARNRGAAEAKGSLLAFTDHDCIADPNWLLEIRKVFDAHPDWSGGGGSVKGAPPNNIIQKFLSLYTLRTEHTEEKEFSCFDLFSGGFSGSSLVFRKEMFDKLGGFQELGYAAGDFDLCARLYHASGKMGIIPNAITYHQHRDSFDAMCRQAYTTGRAQSVLLKKYFPHDWIIEFPMKTFRGRGVSFPIWLNFTYLDKKVLLGLVFAGVWPPLIFVLIFYLIYLMTRINSVAQYENLPLLFSEKCALLVLLFMKSLSMTVGRFVEGLNQKGLSL